MLNRVIVSCYLKHDNYFKTFKEVFICIFWWPFAWKNYGYFILILIKIMKIK